MSGTFLIYCSFDIILKTSILNSCNICNLLFYRVAVMNDITAKIDKIKSKPEDLGG